LTTSEKAAATRKANKAHQLALRHRGTQQAPGTQSDYHVPGAIISDPLVIEHPIDEPPTLTPAQKAAATRKLKKEIAEAKEKERREKQNVSGPRERAPTRLPDGEVVDQPWAEKRKFVAEPTSKVPSKRKSSGASVRASKKGRK